MKNFPTQTSQHLGRRCVAFYFDLWLIINVILIPSLALTPYISYAASTVLLVLMIFLAFICIFFRDYFDGRSIGKRMFGLYVRQDRNLSQPPKLSQHFRRNILVFLWPVELFAADKHPEGKRFGDRWAGTQVIATLPRNWFHYKLIGIVSFAALFLLTLFTGSFLIRINPAYNTATEFIQSQETIQSDTGGIVGFSAFPIGQLSYSNGHGNTKFHIRVLGKTADLRVYIHLNSEPNEAWVVESLSYEIIRVESNSS